METEIGPPADRGEWFVILSFMAGNSLIYTFSIQMQICFIEKIPYF